MEDSSQENLTTRSLLKGILATETVRPAVKQQGKRSISHASVSHIRQDKISGSPAMNLRSQMKAKVRHSIGILGLQDSSVKKNVNTKKKPGTKGFHNFVDELNNITPQSLLKKIIQNEDEASIIISQRSKAAVDHTEEEGTPETKQSSLSKVNLSLPDLQDTEQLDVFRISRKKKRMNISQFEREVDEKLPKNRDNSSNLKKNVEDLTTFVNPNVKTRSLDEHLNFSIDPQSTYKRALLRKPNKAFLVSLGDFEQGVEDKYLLLKGSQECFIESIVEDKSSISTKGVAELNTELYVPPLLSETNNLNSEKRLDIMSNFSLVSSDEKEYDPGDLFMETNSVTSSSNIPIKSVHPNIQTPGMVEENTKCSETTSSRRKSVPILEDVGHSQANQSIQKSFSVSENANPMLHESVSTVNIFESKQEKSAVKLASIIKDGKHSEITKSTENSVLTVGDAWPFELHQNLSKSFLSDKNGRSIKPFLSIQKSNLAEGNVSSRGDIMEVAEHEPYGKKEKHQIDRLSFKIKNSKFDTENGNQYTKSLHISSRQEDNSESSQVYNSENVFQAESTVKSDVVSPECQAKGNKLTMISALVETPAYIRNARFTIPTNKLVPGKKVQKKTVFKTKKDGLTFKSSIVKQLFSLHAKMRLAKEASTDVEKFLEMFLDQMTCDLAAYAAHGSRKTITLADLELLMKRQRLVTDTTTFNVLIERHLPLEFRKLLISCAMSGNKVFPKM